MIHDLIDRCARLYVRDVIRGDFDGAERWAAMAWNLWNTYETERLEAEAGGRP